MIIKFKSGNTKIKFLFEDTSNSEIIKSQEISHNKYKDENFTFETMFTKSDMNLLKEIYEKMPANVISYYDLMYKEYEKFMKNINKENANGDYKNFNSDTLPANGHDIYNYAARYGIANFQIQTVMRLNGRINYYKLVEAVRLSLEAEPIFACHFIEAEPPYWKHSETIDMDLFCSIEETDNPDVVITSFLESPLDMDNDPMLKLKLIRSDQHDVIVLKINHACCDGTGVKEYIQLLSDIYCTIDNENRVFEPKPGRRTRADQDRLFSSIGLSNPDAAWLPGSDILTPTWPFPWKHEKTNTTHFEVCMLPDGMLNEMTRYAKAKGAKINDLILAAFSRAMLNMGEPIYNLPMEIAITVDLRRYLPDFKTEAIRNFSGSVNTYINMIDGESFDDTLSRVVSITSEIKKNYPGLQSAIGLERIEKLSLHDALAYFDGLTKGCSCYVPKCMPSLSNLGYISNKLIKFGDCHAVEAHIIPPAVNTPGLLFMISTYNNVITLSVSYYEGTIQKSDITKLLSGIKQELIEGCKQ